MSNQTQVEVQKSLDANYRSARSLVLAMIALVVALIFVARMISPPVDGSESQEWVRPIYVGTIVVGFAVIIARRLFLSPLVLGPAQQRGAGAVFRTLTLLSLFCGAVGIAMSGAGLLLYLKTGDHQHSLRLGGVGLLLALYSLPRRGEWRKAVTDIS